MRRVVALIAALLLVTTTPAAATETLQPNELPPGAAIGSAPNAIRFAGVDRYHTAAAIAHGLRSSGTQPFGSPDPSAPTWGAATCPSSIIVVAGDRPADALAAAPLSDPTNRSDEPRLTRVASLDHDFDPPGGVDRVDTFAAPIIVTTSGRSGATALAPPARAAAADLRSGGCDQAREAVIVGGSDAVPTEVEAELLLLGYEEVFRVAGRDRYETAALIAAALPGEPAPVATCLDPDASDGDSAMGFYGNGVIEYRASATSCDLHGRTVVLADAAVGADALAAGWWTSFWQTPVLFVAPDGSLPAATRDALGSLAIDTIVVLGGVARIPEPTVDEAKELASAVAGRFGGADRYATSAVTATLLGGWHPTGAAADFDGDRVCLAASSGAATGWPDALAAGPWCGRLTASAAASPSRVLEPVEESGAPIASRASSHAAAPLLLVPASGAVPGAVRALLVAAFPGEEPWCGGAEVPGCAAPGFAIGLGGPAVLSAAAIEEVSGLVAGDDPEQQTAAPTLGDPFVTTLDLSSRFTSGSDGLKSCFERGAIRGVRWLARFRAPDLAALETAIDLPSALAYVDGASAPRCESRGTSAAPVLVGVAADGERTATVDLAAAVEPVLTMSEPMVHAGPGSYSGVGGTLGGAGVTSWRFRDAPPGRIDLLHRGHRVTLREASVDLTIERQRGEDRFLASIELLGGPEPIVGTAAGEAVLIGGRWELAGRFRLPSGSGGFSATLRTNSTAENGDDGLAWELDVNVVF